jgi:hypothetical protein
VRARPCPSVTSTSSPTSALCPPSLRLVRGSGTAVAGVAAAPLTATRPAPHQRARRHHQLHHLRPRPAAARVRCREGQGTSHGPPARGRGVLASTGALHARPATVVIADEGRRVLAASWAASTRAATSTTDVLIDPRCGTRSTSPRRAGSASSRARYASSAASIRLHGAGPRARDPHGAGPVRRRAGERVSPARCRRTSARIDFPWTEDRACRASTCRGRRGAS